MTASIFVAIISGLITVALFSYWFGCRHSGKNSNPNVYRLTPGSNYILSYDINAISQHTIFEIQSSLLREGVSVFIVAFDGMTNKEPLRFFEIERKPDAASK